MQTPVHVLLLLEFHMHDYKQKLSRRMLLDMHALAAPHRDVGG